MPFPSRALLAWYDVSKRAMPWRDDVSPYRTWISEIMLQQTQVDVVRGYFSRFLSRFPDVHSLAAADEADVLSLWAGLGYYSRARNLHRAARLSIERFGGLPPHADGWRDLPGIGRYTLGAVRSIAYGEALPLVDGNVLRVVCRICGLRTRRGDKRSDDRIWSLVSELHASDRLVRARPGDFNQALMELGATVCSSSSPACSSCPVRRTCAAAATASPARYPLPKPPPKRTAVSITALWIEHNGAVLLVERPARGLWAGMWALPENGARDRFSVQLLNTVPLARVERQLTHKDVVIEVLRARVDGAVEGRYVRIGELSKAGMPAAFLAAANAVLAGVQ